ncbi:MAG: DNA translocase FtsK 4TM domain-containing protein, partial [Myxococcota bacterium]
MAADTITEDVPPKKKPARKKRAPAKRTSAASKQKKDAALEPTAPSTDAELSAKAATLPREISGLLTLAIALGILLALVSFEAADLTPGASVRNLIGPVGASIADILLTIFGLGALCLDALMWYLGVMLLLGRRPHVQPTEIIGQILFVAASTLLAHLAMYGERFLDHSAGGVLGEFTGEVLRGLFGTVGAYILGCCVLTMSLLMVTNISLSALVRTLFSALHRGRAYIIHRVKIWLAYRSMLKEEQARLERIQRGHTVEEQARLQAELSVSPLGQERYDFEEDFDDQVEKKLSSKLHRLFGTKQDKTTPPPKPPKAKTRRQKNKGVLNAPTLDARVEDSERDDATSPPTVIPSDGVWSMGSSAPPEASEPSELGRVSVVSPDVDDSSGETLQVDDLDVVDVSTDEPTSGPSPRGRRATQAKEDDGPRIVLESEAKARARRIKDMLNGDDGRGVLFKPQKKGDFELPSLSFLNYEDNLEDSVDPEVLRQMARQIEKTLRDFKVEGQIKDICPGPVITVFEFSPAPGVKISKISNLSDDLA